MAFSASSAASFIRGRASGASRCSPSFRDARIFSASGESRESPPLSTSKTFSSAGGSASLSVPGTEAYWAIRLEKSCGSAGSPKPFFPPFTPSPNPCPGVLTCTEGNASANVPTSFPSGSAD